MMTAFVKAPPERLWRAWENMLLAMRACRPVRLKSTDQRTRKRVGRDRVAELDAYTRRDIGIEPGEITWF